MAKNFVIAFGGTGARCLEALAYLFAARVLREPAHLLLIDPDGRNGNVDRARNLLRDYRQVHGILSPTRDGVAPAFFSTALNAAEGLESFAWEYPQADRAFRRLIGYVAQEEGHQKLLDLLYDETDLSLEFDQGYVGHSHIGALDLVRTLHRAVRASSDALDPRERDPLQTFFRELRSAAQGGDRPRLFVFGSLFGGTGASGLPAVPALVNTLLADVRSRVLLGCVQMGPYFTFPHGDGDRAPDSVRHGFATQAALYHYSTVEAGYDRIYFVGSPLRTSIADSHAPGTERQRNRAHFAELVAALAAAEFMESPRVHPGSTEVYACGATAATWDKLPFRDTRLLRRNLVSFATFSQMYADYLSEDLANNRHVNQKWTFDLRDQLHLGFSGGARELEAMRGFCGRFLGWIAEIQKSEGVHLFDVQDNRTPESLASLGGGGGGKNGRRTRLYFPWLTARPVAEHPYHFIIDRLNRVRAVEQRSASGWYVQALTQAVDEFCRANYQEGWWGHD